jgi:hypothetical protein
VQSRFAPPLNFNPLRFSLPPDPPRDERHRQEERQGQEDDRHRMIAKAAYLRAERRNFVPGHEVEDWLAAQAEIDGANQRL